MHRDGSSVMFPLDSRGVSGLSTSDTLAKMTHLPLILRQLPFRQLNCVFFTQGKWLQKWLYLWESLLNFGNSQSELDYFDDCWSFPLKLGSHFALVFPAAMTSLFGYLFNSVCNFSPPLRNFVTTYNKILYMNIKLRLKQTESGLKLKYTFNFFSRNLITIKTLYINIQLRTKQTDPAYY